MAAKKKTATKTAKKTPGSEDIPSWLGVLREDISGQLRAFSEGMDAWLESLEGRMDAQFREVNSQLGMLKDSSRTHTKEIQWLKDVVYGQSAKIDDLRGVVERIDDKLDNHERRLKALEGDAAE